LPSPDPQLRPDERVALHSAIRGILLFLFFVGTLALRNLSWLPFRSLGSRLAVTGKEELYYTNITEAEARRVGQALKECKYFDGTTRKTVQVAQRDNWVVLNFVVQDRVWDNPEMVAGFRVVSLQVAAQAFDGRPVEVHLCDQYLRVKKTLRLAEESLGRRLVVGPQQEIYYRDVPLDDARKLLTMLKQMGYFSDQQATTVIVARDASGVKVSFVLMPGTWDDPAVIHEIEEVGRRLRREVFADAAEVRLLDELLRVKKTLAVR
jgi:hypothetical protein